MRRMRTTVVFENHLVRQAQKLAGIPETTTLIREALQALIEREASRRLATLRGTMPGLKNVPRRRGPLTRQSADGLSESTRHG